jgi:hypothetical protein
MTTRRNTSTKWGNYGRPLSAESGAHQQPGPKNEAAQIEGGRYWQERSPVGS